MRNSLAVLFLFAGAGLAADADFNGRWNITVEGPAVRAWWLEVTGAGSPSPKVRFVSAYAGDLNIADEVAIRDGELMFGFRYKRRLASGDFEPAHTVYRARLEGSRLAGTSPTKWIGVRAPDITGKDDGSWREEKPIPLFNGKDLAGWEALEKDRKFGWTVRDGVLRAPGGGANLVSQRKFWNFKLHIEFNVAERSNSGIGLRGRYEIQIQDDYGRPPGTHSNGSLYSRIAPSVNACKPAGQWQVFDITLIGRDLTVVLNGTRIIDRQVVEGLTAMGHDPSEGQPGPISLQGDHGPVEFRNIVLTPLVR